MRPDRTDDLQKTHLTSLAATTGIMVFVAWMACFAIQHDSLFTGDPMITPPAAAAANQARVETPPSLD